VTFDHPPTNTVTATTVAELAELVGLIEGDHDLNVVVFDSANPDFYLAHYDVEDEPGKTAAPGIGPTAWLDLLVRLARAPVVSIASIRGHVGEAGKAFARACDLQFTSREKAEEIATGLASCDHEALAQAKSYISLSKTRPDT
jgi:enoyl-CoA hydratase/carnithine racemase